MLLIDYLEEAAKYLREKDQKKLKLESQYRKIRDRDIKKEIALINREIKKKRTEITSRLLLHLDEFRYLNKYFPDLLAAYMEDEHIGKIISKKAWLLDYRPIPPQEAAFRLERLRGMRLQLREAKKFLRSWAGAINPRAFSATFPILEGRLKRGLDKDEVAQIIDKVDKELIREGWLLLITDSLINIPIAKFTNKLLRLQYEEMAAENELKRARGHGTLMEVNAVRKYNKTKRKRGHYETVLIQVLLANPSHLRTLKRKRSWLSRQQKTVVEKIAQDVTPRTVRERAWLDEMNKRLAVEEPEKKKKAAKKPRKKRGKGKSRKK